MWYRDRPRGVLHHCLTVFYRSITAWYRNSTAADRKALQNGSIYILGLVHPVTEGEQVILLCHYWFRKPNRTTFYKDGVEVVSLNVTEMTIDNVISADEGFYKCADPDKKVESPEKTQLDLDKGVLFQV
ncbi:hypothetical protein J4Q44_G00203230 [Coregonus suidteri]|uniref:Ig-like domain-containing protein n=1 Tax=Coregonus suidteri TaxID=861788 RepID=A0AAN8LLX2_9TELE